MSLRELICPAVYCRTGRWWTYPTFSSCRLGLGAGAGNGSPGKESAEERIYGNPFRSMKTGLDLAMNPPLYPLFLAACIELFKTHIRITYAVLAANIIVNALIPALLPRVSMVLWGNAAPGIVAGALSILSAQLIPDWDADYTQLGLVLFCLATMYIVRNYGYGIWQGTIAGAGAGTLFLMSQADCAGSAAVDWVRVCYAAGEAA